MDIQTLITRRAVTVFREPPTLGHSTQVVFVQELAIFSLLAKSPQPMLAHLSVSFSVSERCPAWRSETYSGLPLSFTRARRLCGRGLEIQRRCRGVTTRAILWSKGTAFGREVLSTYLLVYNMSLTRQTYRDGGNLSPLPLSSFIRSSCLMKFSTSVEPKAT